ncbi:TPA: ATP-grasp domain-containing protein [Streptococcus suis]
MKKVLIIGAGFLQDFVICKAKTMGYEVYAVDADPNAIGFEHADHYGVVNIVDEKACLSYAKENNIDGVLTAATDYGVLTTSYIAQEMGLPGLKYEVAQLIKNKYKVRKCLFEHHVDDTEQAYEVHADTDIEKLSKSLSYPVMVKPCDGSGSRGASRVDKAEDLDAACKYAMSGSITHRAEIETFINGMEYGAESLVVNGEVHVLGIMQKWMTKPPYYAELGHSIPNDLTLEVEEKVRNCVTNAIKALGINFGSVNMDLLITSDGKVYIVDIGARMGGNMIGPCIIPYGTGVDYMQAMLQNAVGDEVNLVPREHSAVATKLLAFEAGIVTHLPDMKNVEDEYDVEIYHHLEVGAKVNEYHTNLDGCGYIVAKGNSQEEALKKAATVLQYFKDTIF